MKLGLMFANTGRFGTAEGATAVGKAAEDAGLDSIWTVEHVVVPKGYESPYPYDKSGRMPGPEDSPIPDPLIWLTHVAAVTSSVKLATGILILPQRNPLILAKQCATLDQLSGGRMLLGIGAGWLQEEFNALGVPWEARGRRADEYIEVLRTVWGNQPSSFDGEFAQFGELYSQPAPVNGNVPIIIGGHSEAAARRAGRLGDGFFPARATEEELANLIRVMRQAAEEADRDPSSIEVTTAGIALFGSDPGEAIERMQALGVSRLLIPPVSFDPDQIGSALTDFASKVL